MFGRCKPSFSAAARDKGDGLDLRPSSAVRRRGHLRQEAARVRRSESGCDAATAVDVLGGNAPKDPMGVRWPNRNGRWPQQPTERMVPAS